MTGNQENKPDILNEFDEESRLSNWLGYILWKAIKEFSDNMLEIDDESMENLKLADEHLKSGSLIMFGNHPSMLEPMVLPVFFRKILSNLKEIAGPIAISHMEGFKGKVFRAFANKAKLTLSSVIRGKDIRKNEIHGEYKTEVNNYTQEIIRKILAEAGNLVAMTPFGKRNEIGEKELTVKSGFIRYGKDIYGAFYLPFAIEKRGMKLFLRIGKIKKLGDVARENNIDLINANPGSNEEKLLAEAMMNDWQEWAQPNV